MPKRSVVPGPKKKVHIVVVGQRAYAKDLISFIKSSTTLFHVVSTGKEILTKAGFTELAEREPSADKIQRGKRYFYHQKWH